MFRRELKNQQLLQFLHWFVEPLIGRETWRANRTTSELSQRLTVCDEAYIYLTIESNYDKWLYLHQRTVSLNNTELSSTTITYSHEYAQQPEQKIADRAQRGHHSNCPKAKYTNHAYLDTGTVTTTDSNTTNTTRSAVNSFGNGWSNEGRKRYCELMRSVNESRAFYNSSFDRRMKKYAVNFQLREQRKRLKTPAAALTLLNEFTLPTLASILIDKPNEQATHLNAELLNYEDEPETNNESIFPSVAI